MNRTPLFSVIVLSYNSSSTIIEAVDSIAQLSYKNVELIVSDDCSIDNSVSLCEQWLEQHKERFQSAMILRSSANTGVTQNQRRAINASHGDWIMCIGGDDALFPNSIDSFLLYIKEHPEARMICGKSARYDSFLDDNHLMEIHGSMQDPVFKVSTAKQQYEILLCWACIDAPAVIYHKSVFEIHELQNCGYRGMEDYPRFLKYTKLGNKIFFFDGLICKYRKTATSIQLSNNHGNIITKSYLEHFFHETHNYYYGLDKIARYGVNIFSWLQCYTKSRALQKILYVILYPTYWLSFIIKRHYDYKRIKNALAQENG